MSETSIFWRVIDSGSDQGRRQFSDHADRRRTEQRPAPVPDVAALPPTSGLSHWLREEATAQSNVLTDRDRQIIDGLTGGECLIDRALDTEVRKAMMSLAGQYLVGEKAEDGRPVDPVARFHLGNGARLERINWLADISARGLAESHGLIVNRHYLADEIQTNHEAFAKHGAVAVSSSVRRVLRSNCSAERSKTSPAPGEAAGP